jgi:hypothetical protein
MDDASALIANWRIILLKERKMKKSDFQNWLGLHTPELIFGGVMIGILATVIILAKSMPTEVVSTSSAVSEVFDPQTYVNMLQGMEEEVNLYGYSLALVEQGTENVVAVVDMLA